MSQDQKREVIIDAALKRFAHFGVAKTTMNEIAADLAISKASLYYYFPDKISLYAAVLKSISQANADEEAELQERENDPRLVDEGSYVRRGQTLAIIKTDQLNIDLESA